MSARGVQPIGTVQHLFQWFYVYAAVAPTSGEHFFLELPDLNADNFQIFVDALAQAYPDSLNLLLLDKNGAHSAKRLQMSENVRLVFLPPYSPELNPIERCGVTSKMIWSGSTSAIWHFSAKLLQMCCVPMINRPFNRLPATRI